MPSEGEATQGFLHSIALTGEQAEQHGGLLKGIQAKEEGTVSSLGHAETPLGETLVALHPGGILAGHDVANLPAEVHLHELFLLAASLRIGDVASLQGIEHGRVVVEGLREAVQERRAVVASLLLHYSEDAWLQGAHEMQDVINGRQMAMVGVQKLVQLQYRIHGQRLALPHLQHPRLHLVQLLREHTSEVEFDVHRLRQLP